MDVNSQNFWLILPGLLQRMVDCDFAVIDLEMSGGVTDRDESRYSGLSGKELAYAMAARAATQYNVLEFGLTLIMNPKEKDMPYVTTTYSFAVNNLFLKDTRDQYFFQRSQERVVNFSVSALDFFTKKGVDPMTLNGFEGEHRAGVPFLSRKERMEAIEQAKWSKTYTPVDCEELDVNARTFREESVELINKWYHTTPRPGAQVILLAPGSTRVSLYRRLVAEILEEFPDCFQEPINSYGIRISVKNDRSQKIEDEKRQARVEARKTTIQKQACLSIVFEALCGGNFLDLIDAVELSSTLEACPGWRDNVEDLRWHLEKCQTALQAKRPVLVAHNMAYDLTFLYDTFIGHLPTTLSEFQSKLLVLFPRVIDTKVLATCINLVDGNDPLGVVYNSLKYQGPETVHDLGFGYNVDQGRAHAAGFDSYMTAVVLIRIAHKKLRRTKGKLPPWEHGFWDKTRNTIRLGRGIKHTLGQPTTAAGFCVIL
ncbi:hypothetical protein ACHAQH_000971 [Verticillium albo-atrum]